MGHTLIIFNNNIPVHGHKLGLFSGWSKGLWNRKPGCQSDHTSYDLSDHRASLSVSGWCRASNGLFDGIALCAPVDHGKLGPRRPNGRHLECQGVNDSQSVWHCLPGDVTMLKVVGETEFLGFGWLWRQTQRRVSEPSSRPLSIIQDSQVVHQVGLLQVPWRVANRVQGTQLSPSQVREREPLTRFQARQRSS